MGLSKPIRRGRVLTVGVAAALAASMLTAAGAFAAEAKVKIEVSSAQASAGKVVLTNVPETTTYGTCEAPAAAGSNTCTVEVPEKASVLLVSEPAAGEATGTWSGSCKTVVGDVCHVQTAGSGSTKSAAVSLVPAPTPALTTSAHNTFGQDPNGCGAGPAPLSATGTGFAANTAVTLSDDGTEVASGTTNGSGEATLSYTPSPESGVYRTLTMTAGGKSASNEVYNSAHLCIVANFPEPEKDSITVNAAGLDASSSEVTITVKGVKTTLTTESLGSGSATTQVFACPNGKSVPYTIAGKRGTGAQKYTFTLKLTLTC